MVNSVPHCEYKVCVGHCTHRSAKLSSRLRPSNSALSFIPLLLFYFSLSMHTTTATMWAHTLFLYIQDWTFGGIMPEEEKREEEKRHTWEHPLGITEVFLLYCLRSCTCMELRKSPCRRCSLFRDGPPSFRRERKRKWGLP